MASAVAYWSNLVFTVTILGAFVASYFRQVAIYAGLRVRVAGAFAASKGGYGYRRIRPAFRTRVSEKVLRGIMAEDGLTAHVPERRGYGSYEGETTPAPGNLADRDFTAGVPNGKWPAGIIRDQGQGWEGRASRRRSTAATAGSSRTRPGSGPDVGLADRMLVRATETLPEGAHPLVRSDRGCHCRWPGWLDLMDRYGLARSTGAKGLFPGRRRRGGVSSDA